MAESHCPFCNALLPTLSAAPIAPKVPCPRCGEAVPAARWEVSTAVAVGEPPVRPPMERDLPGVRTTVFAILGIMAAMALISASYALWTTHLRRTRDPWMPTKLTPIAFRRPLELAGLGYLPKDTQLIAAIQVAELVDDKDVGQGLLAEPRPALLDWVFRQVPKTTGMKVEQLDHIVVGGSLASMQLTMVVQMRQPYSLKTLSESVQPTKATLYRDQPLYQFPLKQVGEALLWCVNEHTLVYVIRLDVPTEAHLQGLSPTPRPVVDVLAPGVRSAITERLPKHNFLWTAGHLDELKEAKMWMPFVLGKGDVELLHDLKSFAVGIAPIDGATLVGNFQTTDAKAAERLKGRLESTHLIGATSQKVEVTLPEAPEQWVTWQVRGDVPAMRELLNRGQEMKKVP